MDEVQKFEKAAHDLEKLVKFCKKNNIKISAMIFDDNSLLTAFHGTTEEIAENIVCCGHEDALYETSVIAAYLIAANNLPVPFFNQPQFAKNKDIN